MNEIDEQLKRALRHCEPPKGFADRLLARLEKEPSVAALRPARMPWRWPALRWVAVAALIAVAVSGIGYQIHERQEEAEAKAAKQQVMLALRITGSKLKVAKQRLKAMESGTDKAGKPL